MQKISYKRSERIFDIENFDQIRPIHKRKRIDHTSTNPNQYTIEDKSHKKLNQAHHSVEKFKDAHTNLFYLELRNSQLHPKKLKTIKNEKNSAKISNINNKFCLSNSTNKKCISPNKINIKQNFNTFSRINPNISKHHYSFREKKTLSLRNYITNTSENLRNKYKQLDPQTKNKKKYINQTLKNIISPSIKAPFGFSNSGNNHQNNENKNNKVNNKKLQNSAFNLKRPNNDLKKKPETAKLRNIPKKNQGENYEGEIKDNKNQINQRIKVPENAKHERREGKSQSYNVSKKMRRAKVF